jgi:hypothetical protein
MLTLYIVNYYVQCVIFRRASIGAACGAFRGTYFGLIPQKLDDARRQFVGVPARWDASRIGLWEKLWVYASPTR